MNITQWRVQTARECEERFVILKEMGKFFSIGMNQDAATIHFVTAERPKVLLAAGPCVDALTLLKG